MKERKRLPSYETQWRWRWWWWWWIDAIQTSSSGGDAGKERLQCLEHSETVCRQGKPLSRRLSYFLMLMIHRQEPCARKTANLLNFYSRYSRPVRPFIVCHVPANFFRGIEMREKLFKNKKKLVYIIRASFSSGLALTRFSCSSTACAGPLTWAMV